MDPRLGARSPPGFCPRLVRGREECVRARACEPGDEGRAGAPGQAGWKAPGAGVPGGAGWGAAGAAGARGFLRARVHEHVCLCVSAVGRGALGPWALADHAPVVSAFAGACESSERHMEKKAGPLFLGPTAPAARQRNLINPRGAGNRAGGAGQGARSGKRVTEHLLWPGRSRPLSLLELPQTGVRTHSVVKKWPPPVGRC